MRLCRGVLVALFVAAAPVRAEISREELKQALKDHPDVLVEALRENKGVLLQILNEAVGEARADEARKQAEAEKAELEEALKNPLKPEIGPSALTRGREDAEITIVEYSDFQCPYCRRGFQTVEELRGKYGDSLRFVYKHLPLQNHAEAMPAAKLTEAIRLQSPEKAWQFHDELFQNQSRLGRELYVETAEKLGVDMEKMFADAESAEVREKIEADMREAQSFGIHGTPGFLINGVPLRGAYPAAKFEEIIARLRGEG
jgi:protein-disulfide isomerase